MVTDGIDWSVVIRYDDRSLKSSGYDAYPDAPSTEAEGHALRGLEVKGDCPDYAWGGGFSDDFQAALSSCVTTSRGVASSEAMSAGRRRCPGSLSR